MGRTSDARPRMIAAALDLILGESCDAATVDAICLRAGVRKGSFYHFFPSRQDLLKSAVEAYGESIRPVLDAAFSPLHPPLERLARFCRLQVADQEAGRKRFRCVIGCILTRIASSLGPEDAPVHGAVKAVAGAVLRYLESAIRDGQARGEIRRGAPAALARLLFEHLEGVLAAARILDELDSLRFLEARLLALVRAERAPGRMRRMVK